MADGTIKFYAYDPATKTRNVYDVPEEQADAWAADADKRGIKYSDDAEEAKAAIAAMEAAPRKPAPAKPPPPQSAPTQTPPAQQPRSFWSALGERFERAGQGLADLPGAAWQGLLNTPAAIAETARDVAPHVARNLADKPPIMALAAGFAQSQTGADTARALGRGASFDHMDEGAPLVREALPAPADPEGIPREYAAGSSQADYQAQMRRENAEAAARSPRATGVAMGAGAAPAGIVAAELGGPAAAAAAEGAALSHGASESEGQDLVADTVAGGLMSGALGSTASTVNRAIPRATPEALEALAARRQSELTHAANQQRANANVQRLKRVGANKPQIKDLQGRSDAGVTVYPDESGLQLMRGGIDRYAEAFRAAGITNADTAATAFAQANARKQALNDALTESGAAVDSAGLGSRIRGAASGEARAGIGGQLRDRAGAIADDFEQKYPPKTWRELQEPSREVATTETIEYPLETIETEVKPPLRRGERGRMERAGEPTPLSIDVVEPVELTRFDRTPDVYTETTEPGSIPWREAQAERGNWGQTTDFASGTPDARLRTRIYGQMSEAMEDAADDAVPGSGAQWRQANQDEHMARTALALAGEQERREAIGRALSPSDYGVTAATILGTGNPLAALGAGAGNRWLRGNENRLLEGHALRREASLRGKASRVHGDLMSEAADRRANGVPEYASQIGLGSATLGGGDVNWGALAGRPSAAAAQPAPPEQESSLASDQQAQDTGATQGHNLTQVVQDAVRTNRELLGEYAPQFDQAAGSPGQTASLLERLTKGDERFRRMVLPALQSRAAQAAER